MPHSPDAYLKLSLKLLELFGRQGERRYGFDRYWPLVGAVGTFSEQAVGTLEQEVAKGLQEALERLLRETAQSRPDFSNASRMNLSVTKVSTFRP